MEKIVKLGYEEHQGLLESLKTYKETIEKIKEMDDTVVIDADQYVSLSYWNNTRIPLIKGSDERFVELREEVGRLQGVMDIKVKETREDYLERLKDSRKTTRTDRFNKFWESSRNMVSSYISGAVTGAGIIYIILQYIN